MKIIAFSTAALFALALLGVSAGAAHAGSRTVIGAHGGSATVERSAGGGVANRSVTRTGPAGGTATRSRTCDRLTASCRSTYSATGPYGNTVAGGRTAVRRGGDVHYRGWVDTPHGVHHYRGRRF